MMKNLLLFCMTFLFIAKAQGQDSQAMIQDLESGQYKFSIKYAMSEWKAERFNWTLEGAYEDAKTRILTENPTVKEYQKIFNNFVRSTNDYHVQGIYFSTAMSFFPLKIKGANGHYYLATYGNVSFDGEDVFFLEPIIEATEQISDEDRAAFKNFQYGDELIAINRLPIHEVIEKIIDEDVGGDRTPTGYALAEQLVFMRNGKYGMTVPSGPFEITVKHKGKENLDTYQFTWFTSPEEIVDPLPKLADKQTAKGFSPALNAALSKLGSRDHSVGFAKDLLRNNKLMKLKKGTSKKNNDEDEDSEDDDRREKGFLPELGKVIWQTEPKGESDIYAYLYLNEKGQKIGYLYLPTFSVDDEEKNVTEIIEILRRFESESQALIVDITNNPGGNLLYTYGILSTLTDYPLKTLPERQILIQQDVYRAILFNKMLSLASEEEQNVEGTLGGYVINSNTLKEIMVYNDQIIQSWNAGQKMTDLLYPLNIREVMPHPKGQYTKPLVVVTNELDFSCGDWFPAILQDNGRAVIFGAKTAGAGGSVKGYEHLSLFGIRAMTMTDSIGFRLDGKPIENLGVTPDVSYQVTERDLIDNYVDYKQALNETVESLIEIM